MPDSAKHRGLMGIRMIWFGEGRFLVRTLAHEQSRKVVIFKLFWDWPTDPPRSRFGEIIGHDTVQYPVTSICNH